MLTEELEMRASGMTMGAGEECTESPRPALIHELSEGLCWGKPSPGGWRGD